MRGHTAALKYAAIYLCGKHLRRQTRARSCGYREKWSLTLVFKELTVGWQPPSGLTPAVTARCWEPPPPATTLFRSFRPAGVAEHPHSRRPPPRAAPTRVISWSHVRSRHQARMAISGPRAFREKRGLPAVTWSTLGPSRPTPAPRRPAPPSALSPSTPCTSLCSPASGSQRMLPRPGMTSQPRPFSDQVLAPRSQPRSRLSRPLSPHSRGFLPSTPCRCLQ